jgi:outer membrane protein assembly factor BamB
VTGNELTGNRHRATMGTMLGRIVRITAICCAAVLLLTGALYLSGLRVELDGGGTPRLRFKPTPQSQAEQIARHREAQRTGAAIQVAQPSPAPAVEAADRAVEESEPAGTADAAPVATSRAAPRESAYWTDFRGPNRDGHYRQQPILTNWPAEGLTPIWRQPIGGGYASFVIAGPRAFTIEQRGTEEVAAAYDVASGRELWTNTWSAVFRERMGGDGPRATPTWAEGHVYVLGGTGELRCLDDETGRVMWRTNILEDAGAPNLQWGMAAAPLVVDDTVVVLPGGPRGRSVVAYDRRTGQRAWSALDDQQAYSSPMLVTLAGVRQILIFSASRLVGITTDGREVLWEYPWRTSFDVNASQPLIVGDDRVFVSTGYGTGAAVIELTPAEGGLAVREVWRNIRMKNQFTSSVLHDGFVYGLDESILACVDAGTGELKWKGGRYGYGQVLLASGHLIVLTEGGDLALVRATPESHQELGRHPAIEGKSWNHPAMSDGYLLIRNIAEMAAYDLRLPRRTSSAGRRR